MNCSHPPTAPSGNSVRLCSRWQIPTVGLVLIAAGWACNSPLRADDWLVFRGNPQATGVAQSELPAQLTQIWQYKAEKTGFSATPVIRDERLYIGDLDGTLHVIDTNSGKAELTKKTEAFGFAASPAMRNDRLYLGDYDGVFRCFDLKGNPLWKFESQAEINAGANFYKDQVIFGSQDATLYCLNADTGTLTWKVEVDDQIRCSPTVVEDRSFVAGCDGQLHIIDLANGKELSAVDIEAPTGVTPAAMGGEVYFGTYGGDFFRVDWKEPKIVWRASDRRRNEIRSSPAVAEDIIVFGNRGKHVLALDPKTGKELWSFKTKRDVDASPVISGKHVVIATTDGRIKLVDRKSGETVWEKETGTSFSGSPAVVNQRLYLASDDGSIYCFGQQPAG